MNGDLTQLPPEPAPSINLGQVYSLVVRRAWLIALCLVAAVSAALAYVLIATPIYESTAIIEVQKVQQRVFNPANQGAKAEDATNDDTELKTIEQALQIDSLFTKVVTSPEVVADKNFLPGLGFEPGASPTTNSIAGRFKKYVTIKLIHGTRLFSVSVDHPNAATAQLLCRTLVDDFIAEHGRSKIDTARETVSFLDKETQRFKADLQKAQDSLQVYSQALLLKDQIVDQQKVVLDLSQRYRPKHPRLIQAKSELAQLQGNFDSTIKDIITNNPTEAIYWNSNMKGLEDASIADRVQNELTLIEARTNVLQREGENQSALFDTVRKQMLEADIGKENAPITVDIDQPADLPDKPAKPPKTLIVALAAVGGFALGVLLVFGLHSLDNSLKTVAEVEQRLGLPVLGSLPLIKPGKRGVATRAKPAAGALSFFKNLVLLSDPEGAAAENFRSLRAAIELLGKEKDHRVVLFCSAITNEGKTFTSCNYAVSLAQQGLKTLLIDADLRLPAVHERFELPEKSMGLIEHVSLNVAWDEVIQRGVIENLDVLLPGVKSPNPAEFLSGDGLKDVIRQALTKYDRIVLDSPPVNAVSDTLLIAPYVQAICLVVRAKTTPVGAVERALSLLRMAKARPVGVVFNCIPTDWKSPYSMPKYYYADNRYGQAYINVGK